MAEGKDSNVSAAGCKPAQRLVLMKASEGKPRLELAATIAGAVANPTVLASLLVLKQVWSFLHCTRSCKRLACAHA